ncbi:MAG: MFS transporter [Streptomycetaceae bacterium]|jgi:MFS family permease|nr:MAG: MFS transporter [Streptomycetaceae bacterium]
MSAVKLLPWAKPLLLCNTLMQATIYVLRPMITYRALELDANAAQIGLIAAIYALFPVLLALQFGRLVGKLGEGKFIIMGTIMMMFTSLLLFVAHSLILLTIATALAGVGHLACMVGGQTMVALRTPRENYDRYFGLYTFSAALGHMVGPLLATLIAGSNGNLPKSTSHAFLLGAVLSIIALVPVLSWRRERPTVAAKQQDAGTFTAAFRLVKKPGMFAAIYISLAISSTADVLVVFLPLFGSENNFSPYAIGVILALRSGTTMMSRLFLGRLSERFTTYQLLMWSTLISVLACGAMAFAKTVISLAIIVFIAGFSLGIGQPLTMSLVSLKTQPDERALAVSARLTGNRLGQFLVPAAAGILAAASGAGAVFIGLSVLLGSSIFSVKRH